MNEIFNWLNDIGTAPDIDGFFIYLVFFGWLWGYAIRKDNETKEQYYKELEQKDKDRTDNQG